VAVANEDLEACPKMRTYGAELILDGDILLMFTPLSEN
jgi:hypothetical protein